jgi:hypothetical protein
MKHLPAEARLLRWPLLMFGTALLFAIALCAGAWQFVQHAANDANTAELDAARMRAESQRLQLEEQDMRAKIMEYQRIKARGIIGVERRLDWVDLIRSIQRERKLLGLEYEIQPQQALSGNIAVSTGSGHVFMGSLMQVKIPLLHEADLLNFLEDIRTHAAAFTRLRSCRLQRNDPNNSPLNPGSPVQLNAECQIDWITLMPEGTPK